MKIKTLFFILLITALAVAGYFVIEIYKKIYSTNVKPAVNYINIATGSTFADVKKILQEKDIIKDTASFNWVALKMKYASNIHPGHYVVSANMSNKDLVTLLRSGKQTPVKLTFNSIRTPKELASVVSNIIEADSVSLMKLLNDNKFLKQYGFDSLNCISLFIPNTYEFYWNTSAKKFFERMTKEYKNFWNNSRKAKAKEINFTQIQVSILASVVEMETHQNAEKPTIAGVYINRFNKGWKLEADPTLIFALGNFSIQRVLNEYKEIDSPYNTYLYTGLPPGPICLPSISSIDAVLNYVKHDYMFFCARDDFSGFHSFAKTYTEHLINARRFQKELDRRNIRS